MNETAWNKIQDEKDHRQPTPKVGEPVVWYTEGDKNRPVAALCNGIEGPGRIKVSIAVWQGMPMHRAGCHHISSPLHEKPNMTTRMNGAWDYPRGTVPKGDYDLHDKELTRREESLLLSEEQAEQAKLAFQAKQAQRKADLKKHLPEILPAPA